MAKRLELPLGTRLRAALKSDSAKTESRVITCVFSTGARGFRFGRVDGEYIWFHEELSLDKSHVRMGRLNNGAPVLNAHGENPFRVRLEDQIGVVDRAWLGVEDGVAAGLAELRMSDREAVAWVYDEMVKRIITHVSVGYNVNRYQFMGHAEDGYPIYRAVDWEPCELSPVPMGFDDHATTREIADAKGEFFACEVFCEGADAERANPNHKHKESEMFKRMLFGQHQVRKPAGDGDGSGGGAGAVATATVAAPAAPPAAAAAGPDVNQVRAEAASQERQRAASIRGLVKRHGLDEAVGDDLVSRGVTIDAAREQILERLVERTSQSNIRGQQATVTHGDQDEVTTRREAMSLAIVHRAKPGAFGAVRDDARQFMHRRMEHLARTCLERAGVKTDHMGPAEVCKRALATGDLPLILADAQNKFLRKAYDAGNSEWKRLGNKRTAVDYKPIKNLKLSELGDLEELEEGAKIVVGYLDEGKEQYTVVDYAKMLIITDKLLVNDDLKALEGVPTRFGRAAMRLEKKIFTQQITANAALSDSIALFHADHGNLAGTGSAMDVDKIGDGRAAMRLQKELGASTPMGLGVKFLVVPAALETKAEQFVATAVKINVKKAEEVNPFAGRLEPIVLDVLDATSSKAWYLFCDPADYDTIDYAYLEGKEGPMVDMQPSFDEKGLKIKVEHTFGAGVQDFRGMYKNEGP